MTRRPATKHTTAAQRKIVARLLDTHNEISGTEPFAHLQGGVVAVIDGIKWYSVQVAAMTPALYSRYVDGLEANEDLFGWISENGEFKKGDKI